MLNFLLQKHLHLRYFHSTRSVEYLLYNPITNLRRKKPADETREEIISELRAYKKNNIDWQKEIEKSKVVASYNNRLASMAAPGIDDLLIYYYIFYCLLL